MKIHWKLLGIINTENAIISLWSMVHQALNIMCISDPFLSEGKGQAMMIKAMNRWGFLRLTKYMTGKW